MRAIDADALQVAVVAKGQANERGKYRIGDFWELTGEEIREVIDKQPTIPPEQQKKILYKHYKGGTYELVCNNVTHTETGESLVIYRDCQGQMWARPESMFYGLVKVGDVLEPRFVQCRSEGDAE